MFTSDLHGFSTKITNLIFEAVISFNFMGFLIISSTVFGNYVSNTLDSWNMAELNMHVPLFAFRLPFLQGLL